MTAMTVAEAAAQLMQTDPRFAVADQEIRGTRYRVFANAPSNLREMMRANSDAHGQKDFLIYEDVRLSYPALCDRVNRAAHMMTAMGIEKGDRVAIAMRNYPEWMLSYWAILSIGAVAVGMNAWWVADEMKYGLEDSAPKVLLCDGERLERFLEVKDSFPNLKVAGVRLPDALQKTAGVTPWAEVIATAPNPQTVSIAADDDACIFYTSGTTGRPKGAQLTHRGCVNNILNIAFAGQAQGLALAKKEGKDAEEAFKTAVSPAITAMVATPLFHVTANNCVAHAATVTGGKLVHMYRWDAGEALRLIEQEKVTHFSGVPVMAREIIAHPDFATTDTSTMLSIGGGGAQLQPDLVGKLDTSVKNARPNTGYGMTETCGIITSVASDFFVDKPASAGRAMPTFETKCIDANGDEVMPGEAGELCVKGACVIRGYLNRPEATEETLRGGWLHTGDLGYRDADGYLFLVDRAKDMIIRGGENIYSTEVEDVIYMLPEVSLCAVIGVPDKLFGEEVGAFILCKPGASLTVEAVQEHCRANMAGYKAPRHVHFVEEFAMTATGKIQKGELRRLLEA